MHLVQIFLPLNDNDGETFSREAFSHVREELVSRFGGLTAYARAPADGLWKNTEETTHDRIVIYEVLTPSLDRVWWQRFRQKLEVVFRQESILVRANEVVVL